MNDLGKITCPACAGSGYRWPPTPPKAWERCPQCDGNGQIWRAGGPKFGCTTTVGERGPGEIVELGTGDRVRVLWHMPKDDPATTFVAVFDAFDDSEGEDRVPVDSRIGVASVATRATGSVAADRADHAGDKDADALDPFAVRVRAAEGPLL